MADLLTERLLQEKQQLKSSKCPGSDSNLHQLFHLHLLFHLKAGKIKGGPSAPLAPPTWVKWQCSWDVSESLMQS
jgi:hypothetical protein